MHSLSPKLVPTILSILPLACASLACAQATPSPAGSRSADDVVVLSPFVIADSSDVGYTATNTLAGTRLNTPLADLGTSISVVTKEFMSDIGATDSLSLLAYTTGTEVGGVDGNYAGGSSSGNRPNMDGALASPEQNQRIRGLAPAQLARNYFNTIIPFDAYNTESVTINRGPNALLFGVGSPGGVINNTTLQPILSHNSGEISVRFGPNGSNRESFDLNQSLVRNRLAIRIASENETTNYRQQPAFQKDRRLYLALTAVLFENKNSPVLGPTTLRVNGETGWIDSNPPNSLPPEDGMSGWWSLPSMSLSKYTGTTFPPFYTNGAYTPQYTVNNYGNKTPITLGSTTGPYGESYFLQLALLYGSSGAPGAGLPGGVAGSPGRVNWPASSGFGQFNMFNTGSPYAGGYLPGFTVPSIQNRKVFNYYDYLYTGNTSYSNRNFLANNITLEQSFLKEHLGAEVTYDFQKLERHDSFPFGGATDSGTGNGDVLIDISQYLANGQPNPNLGRPFSRTIGERTDNYTDFRKNYMATAFAQASGSDVFRPKSWAAFVFGKSILTGSYWNGADTTKNLVNNLGWNSTTLNVPGILGYPLGSYQGNVTMVAYTGPSALSSPTEGGVRLSPINIQLPQAGSTYNLDYYDPASRSIQSGSFFAQSYLASGNLQKSELTSKVLSLQSYFFGDHVIGLFGYRTDRQVNYSNVNYNAIPGSPILNTLPDGTWNPAAVALNLTPTSDITGITKTWSLVGVYPFKLPFGADLRVFINSSTNFNPVGVRSEVTGSLLPSPSGITREQGLMFGVLHNRISARVNLFQTTGSNFTDSNLQTAVGPAVGQTLNWEGLALQEQIAGVPITSTPYAAAGITSYNQLYTTIQNLLPEPLRDELNVHVQNNGGTLVALDSPLINPVATSSYLAKGYEIELTGNPTESLRLSMNFAKQVTVESNVAPALAALNAETLALIKASPLANLPDNLVSPDTNTFTTRYSTRVSVPVNAELTKEGTESPEQRKYRVNLVANYTFHHGILSGWQVGTATRWQSKIAIGYPTYVNSAGSQVPIITTPYWGPNVYNQDFWVGYSRRIFNKKAQWSIQLNVRNALGSTDPVPVVASPDGSIAIVRVPPLPETYLTNTIKF